ncbi:MAG: response regulator [Candidatus Omnitrophota bacterium]|nr:response regulator [Candidatus Omnitrophota bacterium]
MKRILIIDDEKEFCSVLKKNLERISGYEVIIANDGKKGILEARKQKPDLILLDIMMPQMNGLEVLKKLKEDKETIAIPVIMLTAKSDEASRIEAAYSYGDDYIAKPVDAQTLRSRIEAIFTRKGGK